MPLIARYESVLVEDTVGLWEFRPEPRLKTMGSRHRIKPCRAVTFSADHLRKAPFCNACSTKTRNPERSTI